MEELLPLESFHAQSDRILRRVAPAAGVAFGAVMGSAFGVSIGLSLGSLAGTVAGFVVAAITGGAFASVWGWSMRRTIRAENERIYDNDPRLMGESLEDSFRYRMPCSMVEGNRLLPGTLYVDQARAAFVPIRRLAKKTDSVRFSLDRAPYNLEPWRDAPRWIRWRLGEPVALQVASEGRTWRFLTPDPDQVIDRLRGLLPAHLA